MLPEIERFCNFLRRRSPQASTPKHYRCDLQIFFAGVGKAPGEVRPTDVSEFIARQQDQGHCPATINRRLAAIRSFYDFLADEDPTLPNPVSLRRHYLRQGRRLPRNVRDADLARLFAVIQEPRDRAIFTLMLRCGLRVGEIAHLRLSDCYLDDPYPRLLVNGKGNHDRSVYLSPQALAALRAYLAVRPTITHDDVFLSQRGRPLSITGIQYLLTHYAQQVGLHVTCHQLRHTFAQNLLDADLPLTSLQQLLGHTSIRTTQVYAHVNDLRVRHDYDSAARRLPTWSSPEVTP